MARKKSALEQERMTDTNIMRVIKLLEPSEGNTPITKKDACQILGMAYNTTRLATIIQNFKDKQERDAKHRAEKRGKPVTDDEVQYIISEYIKGETIDSISKSSYRSNTLIKSILDRHSVPIRKSSPDYFHPELIPEGAMKERFAVGEVVYSARYDTTAKIEAEMLNSPMHGWVYRVFLLGEKWLERAYQPASELASLAHLRAIGVRV